MGYLEFLWNILTEEKVYRTILTVIFGLVFCKVAIKILHNLLIKGKDGYEKKRRMTIFNLMRSIIRYLAYIIMILILLSIFGVNVSSLVASLGIVSVVLGLALQDTIKDFINGVFIITDNFFVVGDTIKYNDFQGEVISLGFRTTKIKDFEGRVKVIANRNISEVINLSQQQTSLYIKVPSSYEVSKKDMEKEILRLKEKIDEYKDALKIEYLGVSSLADSSVYYTLRVDCKIKKSWQLERDIYGLIKEEYDHNHLDIPYQKIEIISENKE